LACPDATPGSYYSLISDDPNTIKVFEYLIRHDKNELIPTFEPTMGFFYPDIVNNCQLTSKESVAVAEKIIQLGLGTKVYHDQVLKCQSCVADQVSVRFHFPFCNSTEIDKELLIEHVADGVMALLSSFKKKEGKLVCPGCGRILEQEGKDYRNVGVWYGCLSCKKQFDTPKVKYMCRSCNKDIEIQDVVISAVYRVAIRKEVTDELSTRLLICRPISDALLEIKLSPSMPGILTGKSGISHTFGMMGTNTDNKTVAIDIAISRSKINEGPILAMSAKVMDTSPTKSIIIAVPGLQENAKKVAGIYNIQVIEGDTIESATEKLRALLVSDSKLLSPPEVKAEEPAEPPTTKGKKAVKKD
jgi:hypothetical protein